MPTFEVGLRQVRRGWEWQIVTFAEGHMLPRARGTAPFRWMARVDAWRCLRHNRAVLAYDPDRAWLDGIDLSLTLDVDAHRALAKALHRAVWDGLASDRDDHDDAVLLDTAHASLYHWRIAGGPLEEARGEWLVSHVYVVLGRVEPALHHARRSYDLHVEHGFGDFDLAYAYEGMARALALAGEDPASWRAKAAAQGATIADDEDRALFEADLAAGPW